MNETVFKKGDEITITYFYKDFSWTHGEVISWPTQPGEMLVILDYYNDFKITMINLQNNNIVSVSPIETEVYKQIRWNLEYMKRHGIANTNLENGE